MDEHDHTPAFTPPLPAPGVTGELFRESAQVERDAGRYQDVSPRESHQIQAVLDAIPDPVLAIDGEGALRWANAAISDVLGWNHREFIGQSILTLVHPDDLNLVAAAMESVTTKEHGDLITVRVRTNTGIWLPLEIRGAQRIIDGEELLVIGARSVHDRHTLELDGGETQLLRSVMANMHGMVTLVDPEGRVRSINGAVTRMLGHDPETLRGQPFMDFVYSEDRTLVYEAVSVLAPGASAHLVARMLDATGDDHLDCEFTVNNMTTDPTVGAYVVSGQVSAGLSDARQRVNFLADHDNRTGLLNRDGFMRSAGDMISSGGGLGLMIIDVVQFRSINELYGEKIGDAVLRTVAGRIDEIRWPDLLAARFGGDEFVLAVRCATDSAVEMLRERVRRELPRAVMIDGQEINIGIRTSTSFEPRPEGLESLLTSASNELMRNKRNADPASTGITTDAINERRQHLDQLRTALSSGQIQPFFQPIVDAEGHIIAVEALVRWVHPLRGVLGVGEILPLAQMAGLAEVVDERVLDMSLDFARQLVESGRPDVEVHVNVDPKVISRPEFASDFLQRCTEHGANPGQIVVEITETDLLAPGAASLNNLHELRRAGIHVSIDDFGTGYSSLSHLLELPVDGVKIDRRFVAGIDIDPAATNLTTAILGLSESLQLGCVAEGVEQPYQRDRLAALGCNAFQGWLYSPAVSGTDVLAMLPALVAVPVDTAVVDYV